MRTHEELNPGNTVVYLTSLYGQYMTHKGKTEND